MKTHILTLTVLLSLPCTLRPTTIINTTDSEVTVTVNYRDERCKPITRILGPEESFAVYETCERNTIEVRKMEDGSSGRIIVSGGYNNKGEIIRIHKF